MSMVTQTHQRGSALIGALFLIIVVAALGAFAVKLQSNQRQEELLQLLQHRVELAAQSGMEYWRFRISNGASCNLSDDPNLGAHAGLLDIQVDTVACQEIITNAGMSVFDVQVEARYRNFGDPEFVRRTVRRTISR